MSVRLAGNPQGRGRSPGKERRGAGAREKLEKAIREAVEEVSRGGKEKSEREVPEAGVLVTAMRGAVWVDFNDVLVISGVPEERRVAQVYVMAEDVVHKVELSTINNPPSIWTPSTWSPSPSLSLLPAAFNTALSLLGTDEALDKRLGVRLRATGVSVRRMCNADDAECAPVVLVDFDVNGRKLTLSNLEVRLERDGDVWGANIVCGALLRHGDRKLAKRFYMLAWLKKEIEKELERFCEEKGYSYETFYSDDRRAHVFRVSIEDKEVEVEIPYIPAFFDEEYVLRRVYIFYRHGDEMSIAEEIMKVVERDLEWDDRASSKSLVWLVTDARRLLRSRDPRLRELGHLLALLIKRAYEEAEMAIPG